MTALIDTNFLYALLDADDHNHQAAITQFQNVQEDKIILSSVLPEAVYLITTRLGYSTAVQFIRTITRPGDPTAIRFVRTIAEPRWDYQAVTEDDLSRTADIMQKYADSKLDFVDATLVAAAERLKITRIWTFDRRDFMMVRPAHAQFFEILPE